MNGSIGRSIPASQECSAARLRTTACALAILGTAGAARADEESERALAKRLAEVEGRLAEMERSARGGYFAAASDLEARVAELERLADDDKSLMTTKFKTGMRTETADGAFSYRWLGFSQLDSVWYWDHGNSDIRDAGLDQQNPEFAFRRVRLGAEGKYYGNVKWQSVIDVANSDVRLADVYMEVTGTPVGNVRVGHFKHPWGMETYESDLFNTFIERGAVDRAFGMARDTGLMVHGGIGESAIYQAGVFRNANNQGADLNNGTDGEYNLTARIAGRPLVQDDGATWLHLGVAGAYRDFDGTEHDVADTFTLTAGMPVPFSTALGSAALTSDEGWQVGLEGAFVTGPLTLRAEYALFDASGDDTGGAAGTDVTFDAWSLEAGFWLTGESTQYSKESATFGRPKPRRNYGDDGGAGAWQMALRYDQMDLSDGDVTGEELDTLTFGVNWWLNPNVRVALNVCRADYEELDESVDAIILRFQWDF